MTQINFIGMQMKTTATINIMEDFSYIPSGRTRDDGPYSAEAFRDDILIEALYKFDKVFLELDDVHGYASSWFHEVFTDLPKLSNLSLDEMREHLEIVTVDDAYKMEIWEYISGISPEDEDSLKVAMGL